MMLDIRQHHLVSRCLPLLLAIGACSAPEDAEGPASAVRDSAGVTLIENHRPLWEEGEQWTLATEPRVTIGRLEGESDYLFTDVSGAARLDGGRIVVLDQTPGELRFYDAEGRFERSVGGRGGGPGEFSSGQQLARVNGDTLLVLDNVPHILSRFDGHGTYLGRATIDLAAWGALIPAGWHGEQRQLLADGSLLGSTFDVSRTGNASPRRREGGFRLLGRSGTSALLRPFLMEDHSAGWLARNTLSAAGGDPLSIAIGDNERYEISLFDSEGKLLRRIRNSRPNDPFTSQERARTRQAIADFVDEPAERQRIVAAFDQAEIAETFPAFAELFIDRSAHLWVRRRRPERVDPSATSPWDVYDPQGRYLGEVTLPGMLRVLDIGEDFVLGVFIADQFLTQQVRLYALDRR